MHVALGMELATQRFRTTKEHASFRGSVDLPNAPEDCIPVRPPEIGGRPQAGDGVSLGIRIVDHDVCSVVGLDLAGQVRVDFD